jgi:two-component system, chemotaxis family, CheB/CheR fusion protein
MENKMTKGEKRDGRGSPQARLRGAQSQAAVASDRQSTPQSIDSEAAEGVGGDFPIVGIGMSAGGLEVATAFLNAMPADSGMGFVIVQHLDPTRESMLVDLLSRETKMPVVKVEDGMRVEPNRVHIIVPAKTLLIRDGILHLVEPEAPRGHRHPIDKFFSALAQDQKAKAIAIVLSGAGSNGTAGLADIKQAGGMCIAQDPETARFDSMPRHAIASKLVDLVLTPAQMPEALMRYASHSYVVAQQPEIDADTGPKKSATGLDDVLALLHARAGHDFSQYKHNTLSRRIHRRMGLAQLEDLGQYLDLLAREPDEAAALVQDLLIHVTAFFRDAEAWEALDAKVITPIVENAQTGQSIRIWVPACSTGEEVYTIAMILIERCEAANKDIAIKVFGTDTAEHHLSSARKATFPGSMVESLSSERIERFFDKLDDNYYRVKPAVRDRVIFAPQNVLKDPPYSRMDLVSCRNLLIYLTQSAQEKVLSFAHFSLREGGYLFLGNAETVGRRDHMFECVSKRWRIYRRLGSGRSTMLDFSQWPIREGPARLADVQPKLADIAVKSLAERFAPASVLIDKNYRVLHFHGSTEEFLTQPAGPPTFDLLSLAREGLRMAVRNAVRKAIETSETVTLQSSIKGETKNGVLVTAGLVRGAGDATAMVLVSFALSDAVSRNAALENAMSVPAQAREIEDELKAAREEMRITVEQYETTNEELTAANEEVTSINEELQATNEELESTKEELQSLNEELGTINGQLGQKNSELADVTDDLRNLLKGSDVATIVLDTELRIKWFSPPIRALFHLIDSDIGRPIGAFTQNFAFRGLAKRAKAAIVDLATFEDEVRADDGRCLLLRVLPYRTQDDRVAGAVITLVDITDLKAKQSEVQEARRFAEAIVETVRHPLLALDGDLRVRSANTAFQHTFGLSPDETLGHLVYELVDGQWNVPQFRTLLEQLVPEHRQIDDYLITLDVPRLGSRKMLMNARCIADSQGAGELVLLAIEDISDRSETARHQELLVGELSHRVKNTLTVVQSIAAQTLRHSSSLETFGNAFQGRLQALARANDAILDGSLKGVTLKHTIERSLKPFAVEGRIVLDEGPPIDLRPQACLAITMILHELTTNAVKYGALSVTTGYIAIAWRLRGFGEAQTICVDWREHDGPAVAPPSRRGQGTRFIEQSIAYELGGTASVVYEHDGLRATLNFPFKSSIMPETLPELTEGSAPSGR